MTVDLTQVLIALIGGILSVTGIVATALINAKMSNAAASAALGNAVKNSLGAIQQAADGVVTNAAPHVTVPGLTLPMSIGVQYVLDHAGDEASQLGITQAAIADKINAQIGLTKVATAGTVAGTK